MRVDARTFACDWPDCRKSFLHTDNLASHRRQHVDPKPFRCAHCPLAYWQKSSLRSHQAKQHHLPPTAAAAHSEGQQLVDGIIRSVTASMRGAVAAADIPDTETIDQPTGPPSSTLDHTHVDQPRSGTRAEVGGEEEVIADEQSTGEDHRRRGAVEVLGTAQDHPRSAAVEASLNVYEFCDDDAVNISRPSLRAASTDTHHGTVEQSRSTIETSHDATESPRASIEPAEKESDEEGHDTAVFDDDDDDVVATVDRLAETTITYSRSNRKLVHAPQPTSEHSADCSPVARLIAGGLFSDDDVITTTSKKSPRTRRKPSTSFTAHGDDVDAPARKKMRRMKRNEPEVAEDGGRLESVSRTSKLSARQTNRRRAGRKVARPALAATSTSADELKSGIRSEAGAETDGGLVTRRSSSAARKGEKGNTGGRGGRRGRGKTDVAESEKDTSVVKTGVEVLRTGVGTVDSLAVSVVSDVTVSAAAGGACDEPRRKRRPRGRIERVATRRSVRRRRKMEPQDVDDDDELLGPSDTPAAAAAAAGDVDELRGSESVGMQDDDGGTAGDVGRQWRGSDGDDDVVGPEVAEDDVAYQSDNTEILSIDDSGAVVVAAAAAPAGDDGVRETTGAVHDRVSDVADGVDDEASTRRSSPASYNSDDEHIVSPAAAAACDDNTSRGTCNSLARV